MTEEEIKNALVRLNDEANRLSMPKDLTHGNLFVMGARWYRDEMRKRWPSEAETRDRVDDPTLEGYSYGVQDCYEWLRSRVLGEGGGG